MKRASAAVSGREPNGQSSSMETLHEALLLDKGGVVSIVGAGGKTSLMFRLARELSVGGDTVLTTTTTKIHYPEETQSRCVIIGTSTEDIVKQAKALIEDHHHITAAKNVVSDQNKLLGLTPETVDRLWESRLFRWIIVEADGAAGRPLKAPAAHEPLLPLSTGWLVGLVGLGAVGHPVTDTWVFRPDIFTAITGRLYGEAVTESDVATLISHKRGLFKDAPPGCRRLVFLNQADARSGTVAGRRICGLLKKHPPPGIQRVILGQLTEAIPLLTVWNPSADGADHGEYLQ